MSRVEEPSIPGWYQYDGGHGTLMFLLDESSQWHAIASHGSITPCDWGYIEQALGVYNLIRIEPPNSGELNHNVFSEEDQQYGPSVDRKSMQGSGGRRSWGR